MAYSHVASDPQKLQSFIEAYQRGDDLNKLRADFGILSSTDVRYLLYKGGIGEKPNFPSEHRRNEKDKAKRKGLKVVDDKKEQFFAVVVSGIKCSVSVPNGMSAEAEVVDSAINFKITL